MGQKHLNHLMLLHLNKERQDSLDLNAIGNEFVQGSEHGLHILNCLCYMLCRINLMVIFFKNRSIKG